MACRSNRGLWTAYLKGEGNCKKIPFQLKPREPFEGYVLGIDPSVRATGLALLFFKKDKPELINHKTLTVSPNIPFSECMGTIFKGVESIIPKSFAGHVAVESTVYVQNFSTVHKLGSARGAAMAAVSLQGWNVFEYAPLRVKQAVSGMGKATKEQMIKMISQHLSLNKDLTPDEADAAGVALCHAWSYGNTFD